MAIVLNKNPDKEKINKKVVLDPLSEKTRKVRRNLLLASGLAILTSLGGKPSFGYSGLSTIDLKGVFFIILLYLIVSFWLYLRDDLKKYSISGKTTLFETNQEYIQLINSNVDNITKSLEKLSGGVDPGNIKVWSDTISESINNLSANSAGVDELIKYYYTSLKYQRKLLWGLDIILPSLFGAFSLVKLSCGFFPLIYKLM